MTRNLVLACTLFSVLLFAAARAHAVVEHECFVALQVKSGWSAVRKRRVHFMTGMELSRFSTTLNVEFHHIYAVISHGSGLPTVTRLDTVLLGIGREFTDNDFARLFGNGREHLATQLDGEGRTLKWRLCSRTLQR